MASMTSCNVCQAATRRVLALNGPYSLTSLGRLVEASAEVFVCAGCSHAQTVTSIDLAEYYANEYKTLAASADEDDLYEIRAGVPVYRNQHMSTVLTRKLPKIEGRVLDFGCGKSLVMKHYAKETGNRSIYLYDVSQDYRKFWDAFVPEQQYACFEIPVAWNGTFQLVTSFFSMEHVPQPISELRTIRRLLSPTGLLYLVVPNMYRSNAADMLVVDHIQHFSESSMKMLLRLSDFTLVEADHTSHEQGSIYIARPSSGPLVPPEDDQADVQSSVTQCLSVSTLWSTVNRSVRLFESELLDRGVERFFIVGAGIVGTHLYAQIQHRELLAGFVDSNAFKQEKGWQGLPVLPPGHVTADAKTGIFCGLNSEQIETVLPKLLPQTGFGHNVWTMKDATR